MGMDPITQEAQTRVETVGKALLARDDAGRPSFNEPADGTPTISGVAQVGSTLTAEVADVDDVDGVPTDADGDKDVDYQWLRNGEAIPGATSSTYTLGPDDNEKTISVQVSFTTTHATTRCASATPPRRLPALRARSLASKPRSEV